MTPQQEIDALTSNIVTVSDRLLNTRRQLEDKHTHLQVVLAENKELKEKKGGLNIFYALALLVLFALLLTAVADDIRLRFVIAEYTLMTEELLVEVERYTQVKEAQTKSLEGMVFSGADAMTGCADTLNLCNGRVSELGVELEKTLGREAKWKSVAQECLGLSD